MKQIIIMMVVGVMAFMSLPLTISAAEIPSVSYPLFGPQGADKDDPHLYFGDSTFPRDTEQGITLTVDESSISFQSVIVDITMPVGYVEEREITGFYITANDRIVDWFMPAWDYEQSYWKRGYYSMRVALDDWNVNSIINLRVVAISHREDSPIDPTESNRYVVGWSNMPPAFRLKAAPVIDREAITVLEAILAKLEQLKSSLEGRLDQINKSVKDIYEIKPQTQQKFDAALANLQSKLPTEQMKKEAEQMSNVVKDSANRINNAQQKIKFGEISWMGVVTTPVVDFTEFMDEITAIRKVVQITLWCEFFYFVILILRPRLTV